MSLKAINFDFLDYIEAQIRKLRVYCLILASRLPGRLHVGLKALQAHVLLCYLISYYFLSV